MAAKENPGACEATGVSEVVSFSGSDTPKFNGNPRGFQQVGSSPDLGLPALVERAAGALASAKTAAEILDAREMANVVYDAAKRAARLAKAKSAHDEIITKIYRAQADAMEIEAGAKRRLADEYDAAQERGEVGKRGDYGAVSSGLEHTPATSADLGISRKDIHDARAFRDAEEAEPDIVRRVADEAIAEGQEPTKARVKRAVYEASGRSVAPPPRGKEVQCISAKEAIGAMASLWTPAQMVAHFTEFPHLAIAVDEKLPAAVEWLTEFAALWGETHRGGGAHD